VFDSEHAANNAAAQIKRPAKPARDNNFIFISSCPSRGDFLGWCSTEATGLIKDFARYCDFSELPLRDSAGLSPDFAGFYTLQLLLQRHDPTRTI